MESQYLNLLAKILNEGDLRSDRTGIGTYSLFGEQLQFDLRKGFPLLTTKKMAWKSILGELIWFIRGSQNNNELALITHGKPAKTIWTENAEAPYWKPNFDGDVGRIYGVQWRRWRKYTVLDFNGQKIDLDDFQVDIHIFGEALIDNAEVVVSEIDQLEELIKGLRENPFGRRHILTAWNVAELDQMSLPPCHIMSQFYVNSKKELSCHLYQRSVDTGLGLPFNIASYALLTHILAQICELKVGRLVMSFGDAHIYLDQVDQLKEQLTRTPYDLPTLWINPSLTDIDKIEMSDFRIDGYIHHPPIKMKMAV